MLKSTEAMGDWCLPVQGIVGIVRRSRYQYDLISIVLPESDVSKSLDTFLLEIVDIVVDIQRRSHDVSHIDKNAASTLLRRTREIDLKIRKASGLMSGCSWIYYNMLPRTCSLPVYIRSEGAETDIAAIYWRERRLGMA